MRLFLLLPQAVSNRSLPSIWLLLFLPLAWRVLTRVRRIFLLLPAAVCLCAGSLAAQTAYVGQSLGGGFSLPWGMAVDGNGNVYVTDTGNNLVKEIPAGCTSAQYSSNSCTITTLGGGFSITGRPRGRFERKRVCGRLGYPRSL